MVTEEDKIIKAKTLLEEILDSSGEREEVLQMADSFERRYRACCLVITHGNHRLSAPDLIEALEEVRNYRQMMLHAISEDTTKTYLDRAVRKLSYLQIMIHRKYQIYQRSSFEEVKNTLYLLFGIYTLLKESLSER